MNYDPAFLSGTKERHHHIRVHSSSNVSLRYEWKYSVKVTNNLTEVLTSTYLSQLST